MTGSPTPHEQRAARQAEYDAQRARLNELTVVNQAEGAVASVRIEQLADEQAHAYRRVSGAKGWLTRALRDGNAAAIAAARARVDELRAAADALSDANIMQMRRLMAARLTGLRQQTAQMSRTWDAGSQLIEGLTDPRRGDQSGAP